MPGVPVSALPLAVLLILFCFFALWHAACLETERCHVVDLDLQPSTVAYKRSCLIQTLGFGQGRSQTKSGLTCQRSVRKGLFETVVRVKQSASSVVLEVLTLQSNARNC
jgi:hypothetical protein